MASKSERRSQELPGNQELGGLLPPPTQRGTRRLWKGVLTVDEADQLKTENAQDSTADFDKALNSKFPMPD